MDRKTAVLVLLSVAAVSMGARMIMRLSRTVHAPPSAAWTPLDVQQLEIQTGAAVSRADWLVAEEDRIAMTSCIVARYTAAIPGGPAAQTAMLERDADAERAVSLEATQRCTSEYADRVFGADKWLPQFRALYVHQCVGTEGALAKAWCDCMGTEVERRFASPAAFRSAKSRGAPSDSERHALEGLQTACKALRDPLGSFKK